MVRNVPIPHKIAALVIALGAVCIGLALFARANLAHIAADYADVTHRRSPALVALAGAERANYQMAYGAAMVIAYPGASEEGRAWARSVTRVEQEGLGFLAQARAAAPEYRIQIERLEAQLRANKVSLDRSVELALGDLVPDATRALTAADPAVVRFGGETQALIARGVADHRRTSAELASGSAATGVVLFVVSLSGVAAAVLAALWLSAASITRPLAALRQRMQALAEGDSASPVDGQERGDEIGDMARAVQVFRRNALSLAQAEVERAELLGAKLRAEAADQAKRQFLAHMSHELRTPLNGLLTMAQLLADEPLAEPQRAKLDIIRRSGRDLLHVINNILDFSKIEVGKLELEPIAFDAAATIEEAAEPFAAQAALKGVALRLDVDASARGTRLADAMRLRQILNNYLSNATKFTQTGEIELSVLGLGENGRAGLRISVRDTGPGLSEGDIAQLFRSFSQLDSSTTRRHNGTGLGLAICHELAELMGGRVWADGTPGVGACFHAEVSAPRIETPGQESRKTGSPERPVELSRLRVLAAEDNLVNQQVLATILDALGVHHRIVGDGREALEAWRDGDFDLILMDIQMPEMDGLDAARAIRAEEDARGLPQIPIVALTANAFVHQVDEYAAAGMDAHLPKPIDVPLLHGLLAQVAARTPAAAGAAAA